jgi:hypothetical protein
MVRAPTRTSPPPPVWQALLSRLGSTPRLTRELWCAYRTIYPFTALTVEFEFTRLASWAPAVIMEQREQHLQDLLPPRTLLETSAKLSPEGTRRRRDVVRFEAAVLTCMDKSGLPLVDRSQGHRPGRRGVLRRVAWHRCPAPARA